jgi:hypothetical protein
MWPPACFSLDRGPVKIGHLHVGLKGTMNALYLKELADKTRRGLRGRVEAGKSGGGICYGHRVVRALGIFREYAEGMSPQAIAKRLNAERVPGPGGHTWGPSTLHGHARRGTGILNNELYVGRLVWNRQRYVKDPDTGRRVSRPNPESEWIVSAVPDLRILPDTAWHAAKDRQRTVRQLVAGAGNIGRELRPLHLFSGLIHLFSGLFRCGACGGEPRARENRGRDRGDHQVHQEGHCW